MKKVLILSSVLMLLFCCSQQSFAQQTDDAQANARASIVVPISISSNLELNFGNVAVSASNSGTVRLDPTNNTRYPQGGVSLPATMGTVQAATFNVSGAPYFTYSITLPTQVNVSDGVNVMLVNDFRSNPLNNGSLDAGGNQLLTVGATLNVNANQPPGNYVTLGSGFSVLVQYN